MRSKSANSPAHSPSPDGVTPQVLVPTRSALDIGNNGYIGDIEEDGGCDPIEQALLAEQEENRKLREDNLQAREHNRILVNRLQNAGESVSPQAGESELLIPEISRDLLDNLVRENLRLKRDMMTRPTTLNSSQLEQVCQERDQLASQLREVQSVLGASSDKKDAEIHRLSSELADARTETQELAAQCRQLVQQQDENKRSHLITENIQKMSLENGNASLSVVQLKQQNNELQSQLLQLRTEFQEVVGSNKQWQMYDKQREEHIHRLTAEKQDLKIQLARGGAVGFPQQEMSMRKLQESENERQHLLACNQAMEHRIQHLERAINTTPSQEERERIHVLESQVQVFKEDFHQERNDREKAQTRAAKLEDENSLLKQQYYRRGTHCRYCWINSRPRTWTFLHSDAVTRCSVIVKSTSARGTCPPMSTMEGWSHTVLLMGRSWLTAQTLKTRIFWMFRWCGRQRTARCPPSRARSNAPSVTSSFLWTTPCNFSTTMTSATRNCFHNGTGKGHGTVLVAALGTPHAEFEVMLPTKNGKDFSQCAFFNNAMLTGDFSQCAFFNNAVLTRAACDHDHLDDDNDDVTRHYVDSDNDSVDIGFVANGRDDVNDDGRCFTERDTGLSTRTKLVRATIVACFGILAAQLRIRHTIQRHVQQHCVVLSTSTQIVFGLLLTLLCCKKILLTTFERSVWWPHRHVLAHGDWSWNLEAVEKKWWMHRRWNYATSLQQLELLAIQSSLTLAQPMPFDMSKVRPQPYTCSECYRVRWHFPRPKSILFIQRLFYHTYLRCLSMLDYQLFRLYLILIVLVVGVVLINANSYHSNRPEGKHFLFLQYSLIKSSSLTVLHYLSFFVDSLNSLPSSLGPWRCVCLSIPITYL